MRLWPAPATACTPGAAPAGAHAAQHTAVAAAVCGQEGAVVGQQILWKVLQALVGITCDW